MSTSSTASTRPKRGVGQPCFVHSEAGARGFCELYRVYGATRGTTLVRAQRGWRLGLQRALPRLLADLANELDLHNKSLVFLGLALPNLVDDLHPHDQVWSHL